MKSESKFSKSFLKSLDRGTLKRLRARLVQLQSQPKSKKVRAEIEEVKADIALTKSNFGKAIER